jgi:hypothetical protein
MVRHILEEIEKLHSANSARRDVRRSDPRQWRLVEIALADCLQELRAIVAAEALDDIRRRPALRFV